MPDGSQTATLNIYQRIHGAMGEVDYVQKDKKQGMNYTVTSHDKVTALVRPILHKHGVIYYPVEMTRTQDGNRTEVDLTVRFQSADDPDQFMDVKSCGYGCDAQDKGPGKAISYAVKYALLKALGLETGDDPDHEQIEHKPAKIDPKEKWANDAIAWLDKQTDMIAVQKFWKDEAARIKQLEPYQFQPLERAKEAAKVRIGTAPNTRTPPIDLNDAIPF